MSQKKKVLVVGEVLIDLIQGKGNNFVFSVGGAPFNVARNLASLGVDVDFSAQVGNDYFGDCILKKIESNKRIGNLVRKIENKNTTIALNIEENKERKYSFIRRNSAELDYNLELLNKLSVKDYSILHIGSLFLSDEKSIEILKKYVEGAKANGLSVSFDVNLRKDIFDSEEVIKERYKYFLENADYLKMSEEEFDYFFAGKNPFDLFKELNIKVLLITKGNKGASMYLNNKEYFQNTFKVKVKDTVGAGDSFYSGFLSKIIESENLTEVDDFYYIKIMEFASACGALTCSKEGALVGYNSVQDVIKFINKVKRNVVFKI